MKKLLIAIPVVLVVVVGGFALAGKNGNGDAVEVQTEPVQKRRIVETVTATGRIQPVTQVNISADVSAKITRLEVDEGDWVDKGQLLLELDRERLVAAVESAEANLNAAEANANLARENMVKAEKDHGRTESLHRTNLESESSLDAAYASWQVERARHDATLDQVEQARAALKQARDDLSKTSIYAPMSGTVSVLNKEVGEICLGSAFQEDVIMVISNLSGMEALVDVDENDIVSVALADTAEIEVDALPDALLPGEVTEIASSAKVLGQGTTDQRTEFEVKVAVTERHPALRPGMTASCEIVTEVREDALSVPIQSVAVRTPTQLGVEPGPENPYHPDKDGFVEVVFVVADGAVSARQVTTGVQGESHIEIVDGLDEGDEVVVGSYRAISRDLQDGTQVAVTNAGRPRAEQRG